MDLSETGQLKINYKIEERLFCVFGCQSCLGLFECDLILVFALFKSHQLCDPHPLLHLCQSLLLPPLVNQADPLFSRLVPLHQLLVASTQRYRTVRMSDDCEEVLVIYKVFLVNSMAWSRFCFWTSR
jgi:hypothetical protein